MLRCRLQQPGGASEKKQQQQAGAQQTVNRKATGAHSQQ
jgi:hypothetical protein